MNNNTEGIILNRMYAGDYLDENIGHEIINLFRADDNCNYIYLCKDGVYSKQYLPKYTIQVRTHSTRTLEIISIAEIQSGVTPQEIDSIRYGTVNIIDIFASNAEQRPNTYVTFKAKRVIKPHPQHPVYIAYEGNRTRKKGYVNTIVSNNAFTLNEVVGNKYNFDVSESLRNYIDENPEPNSDYSKLKKIIEDAFATYESGNGDWIAVEDKIITNTSADDSKTEDTPAEIYGIGNLELPFSNAFSFFLRKFPQLLLGLCKYLKNDKDEALVDLCAYFAANPNAKITIKREWKNIDILINIDNEWVIVVENKIFSDLNGKVGKELSQLDKYFDIAKTHFDSIKQLFVLLTPNHNNIDIQKYHCWRKLFYSKVYDYLITTEEYKTDQNLYAFTTMIGRHCDIDYNLGEMKRRFERALKATE